MIGIDEAGRGSLAGSMYLVGVQTPSQDIIEKLKKLGLRDSKKISKSKRKRIFDFIINNNIKYYVVKISPNEIDTLGLSNCYKKGLTEIYNQFDDDFIFDGNTLYGLNLPIKTETKADDKYIEVSIASIIAKVLRDKEIEDISKKYPEYLWEKHNGYPQKIHKEKIKELGYIEGIHRKSWKIN